MMHTASFFFFFFNLDRVPDPIFLNVPFIERIKIKITKQFVQNGNKPEKLASRLCKIIPLKVNFELFYPWNIIRRN